MAYSKTPQFNSHQLTRVPISSSFIPTGTTGTTVGVQYINCTPRTISQYGTDPERILIKRPSITAPLSYGTTADGVLRGVATWSDGGTHNYSIVKGATIFIDGGTRALTYSVGSVGAAHGNIAGVDWLCLVETDNSLNSRLPFYNFGTNTFTTVVPSVSVKGDPVFLNGYFFVAGMAGQRIYNSEVGDPLTWTMANNFIDAEMYGDDIVTLAKHRNHLVAFGRRSIEFFYDGAVEVGSPLVRQESFATSVGMATYLGSTYGHKTVSIGNNLYFLGNVNNTIGFYKIDNFKTEKVSSPYINKILNNIDYCDITGSSLLFINWQGVECPVIKLKKTGVSEYIYYCYDPSEKEFSVLEPPSTITNLAFSPEGGAIFAQSTDNDYDRYWVRSTDDQEAENISATVTFDYFDGGVDSMKHIKYVDILGSIGTTSSSNTVALYYSKEFEPYTFSQSTQASGSLRFRNITRARRVSFRIVFTGAFPINFRGLDIAYNLGVY